MEKLELLVKSAAGAVLLSRFGSLWTASSPEGKRAAGVLLALALLKPRRLEVGTTTTLIATLFGLASAFRTKSSDLLRWIVTLGSAPVLSEAIRGGDADIPAVLAICLGLLLDHCSAAAIILIMVTGGEALEEHALERAGSALHSLLERSPGTARLADSVVEVPADKVREGDEILIKQGEVVPVDGTLIAPDVCVVDERVLTGECISATKKQGELVMAGSTNGSGAAVRIRANGGYENSILHQMQFSLKAALERKGKIELASKQVADSLTPLTLALAAAALEFAIRKRKFSPGQAWRVVLSVLMSATPCPAAIGVPIAMLSGMSVSSKLLGATVKSGEALESLSVAKVLVLDKTGTITTGKPTVSQVIVHTPFPTVMEGVAFDSERTVLDYLAHVEFQAKHVLADAVVRRFEQGGGVISRKVTNFQNEPGKGVRGVVDDKILVLVGSKSFCFDADRQGVHSVDNVQSAVHLVSYFRIQSALGGVKDGPIITGAIAFEDPIRPEAVQLVDRCTKAGMEVVILSGDSSNHLQWVASQLNIRQYRTCLPHEKVSEIQRLQKELGTVVMVGDGANDSAALAAADVGISVDPSGMASESAKVVLLTGDVSKVYELIRLSNHVVTVARRTVSWGMMASAVQMVFAATGSSTPFVNAAIQEMVDLGATLHSLRALQFEVSSNANSDATAEGEKSAY